MVEIVYVTNRETTMADWYYYNENGERVGPIRGRDLKQLARQGVVTPETKVENAQGHTAVAINVKGLTFLEPSQPHAEPSDSTIQSNPLPETKSSLEDIVETLEEQDFEQLRENFERLQKQQEQQNIPASTPPPVEPNPFTAAMPAEQNPFTAPLPKPVVPKNKPTKPKSVPPSTVDENKGSIWITIIGALIILFVGWMGWRVIAAFSVDPVVLPAVQEAEEVKPVVPPPIDQADQEPEPVVNPPIEAATEEPPAVFPLPVPDRTRPIRENVPPSPIVQVPPPAPNREVEVIDLRKRNFRNLDEFVQYVTSEREKTFLGEYTYSVAAPQRGGNNVLQSFTMRISSRFAPQRVSGIPVSFPDNPGVSGRAVNDQNFLALSVSGNADGVAELYRHANSGNYRALVSFRNFRQTNNIRTAEVVKIEIVKIR